MKLKKIASLALAGVMAVSMLAGCAGKTNTDTNTDVTTPATGISAKIDAALDAKDNIALTDNATYAAWLSKAIQDADLTTADVVKYSTKVQTSGDVYDALKAKFDALVKTDATTYLTSNTAIDFSTGSSSQENAKEGTYVRVMVSTYVGNMTEDVVVSKIADDMNTMLPKANVPATTGDTGSIMNHTYTGSVSMQKVTSGDATVWFVLTVVEHTVAKA